MVPQLAGLCLCTFLSAPFCPRLYVGFITSSEKINVHVYNCTWDVIQITDQLARSNSKLPILQIRLWSRDNRLTQNKPTKLEWDESYNCQAKKLLVCLFGIRIKQPKLSFWCSLCKWKAHELLAHNIWIEIQLNNDRTLWLTSSGLMILK